MAFGELSNWVTAINLLSLQFRTARSSQTPSAMADVRKVESDDRIDPLAVSGYWPAMPHPDPDASIFSQ